MSPSRRSVVGALVGLLLVGAGVWVFQEQISGWWRNGIAVGRAPGEVSAERADDTRERIREFASGRGPDSLILRTADLQSLLQYGDQGLLPSAVRDPDLALTDSGAVLRGILLPGELPEESGASGLQGLLGDSTEIRAEVAPGILRAGVAEVRVRRLEAASLNLPAMFIPTILRRSGLPVEDGRPRSVVFAVPERLVGITVRDSVLVLRRSDRDDDGR